MAELPKKEKSYIQEVIHFYFSPGLRSVGTLVYLAVFGYACLYYIDNVFLAIRFIFYVLFGHHALSETAYLFSGMIFVVSLSLPFFISFYSILILHRTWDKPTWAIHVKWLITTFIIVSGLFLIVVSDKASRFAAHDPSMQSFIEDAGLNNKI